MNLPAKSTASSKASRCSWSESRARQQYLLTLFPDWTGGDPFLLKQLQASIEAAMPAIKDPNEAFATFTALADNLRGKAGMPLPSTHAIVRLDYSGKRWDPLFARQEIIQQLKRHAGADHVFLVVQSLRRALFPHARYRTASRERACAEARAFIEVLARRWSTRSSTVHLFYFS
jgi:hypothetical protein